MIETLRQIWRKHQLACWILLGLLVLNLILLIMDPGGAGAALAPESLALKKAASGQGESSSGSAASGKRLRDIGAKHSGLAQQAIIGGGTTYEERLLWETQGLAAIEGLRRALRKENLTLVEFMNLPFPKQHQLIEENR